MIGKFIPALAGGVLAAVLAAGASAGGNETQVEGDPAAALQSCGGAPLLAAVGGPVAAVQADLPEGARVIAPDSAVTRDFREERINLDVDAAGLVLRVWCG